MTITERIFHLLTKSGLSQKEFAKSIGINEKTVSAWKKNNSLPPADKLSEISDFLNVSIDYLLKGKEPNSQINVSDSHVGAVGHNISGTINIGNDSSAPEANQSDNTSISSDNDEMTEELLRIFKTLPLKERTKIMTKVYEIEDEYVKKK